MKGVFQMNVVLFGYGYMGRLIYKFLKENQSVKNIYIVDPNPRCEPPVACYDTFENLPEDANVSAAFIASNSITHCDVLEKVLKAGIKNIFCEKPMCLTQDEYKRVQNVAPKDARIVVDYLLRSSGAVRAVQKKIQLLKNAGYKLIGGQVDYGKDKTKDPRRFRDIGVYEELYHIWDLCLNGPLFGKLKDVQVARNIPMPDEKIDGRIIQQRFKYILTDENDEKIPLKLMSSFQKSRRQRSFIFFFSKKEAEVGKNKVEQFNLDEKEKTRIVSLIFDNDFKKDQCLTIDEYNHVERLDFEANKKLENMINDSIIYFSTGKKASYLHSAEDSQAFHTLLEQMKQVAPMNKSAIMERIVQKKHEQHIH